MPIRYFLAMVSCSEPGNISRWQTNNKDKKNNQASAFFRPEPRSCIGLTGQVLDEEFMTAHIPLNTEHLALCTVEPCLARTCLLCYRVRQDLANKLRMCCVKVLLAYDRKKESVVHPV